MTVSIGISVHTTIATANVGFIQDGWTPLMTASFEGHVDIVRLLLEANTQVHTREEV